MIPTEQGEKMRVIRFATRHQTRGTLATILLVSFSAMLSVWAPLEAPAQVKLTYPGWVVGWPGVIGHVNDGKDPDGVWTPQCRPEKYGATTFFNVFFVDGTTGWIVGSGGAILNTTDGGKTCWKEQTSGVERALYGVWFTDAHRGWVVGAGGTILHTINGGKTWDLREKASLQTI